MQSTGIFITYSPMPNWRRGLIGQEVWWNLTKFLKERGSFLGQILIEKVEPIKWSGWWNMIQIEMDLSPPPTSPPPTIRHGRVNILFTEIKNESNQSWSCKPLKLRIAWGIKPPDLSILSFLHPTVKLIWLWWDP